MPTMTALERARHQNINLIHLQSPLMSKMSVASRNVLDTHEADW